MPAMSVEEEAVEDAKVRLQQLDHKVDEAKATMDDAPDSDDARATYEMMVAIRDVAKESLAKAEAALAER